MSWGSIFDLRRFVPSPRFLPASSAAQDVESFLAGARAFLAVSSFLVIGIDPSFPPRFVKLAYVLLYLYLVHSFLVLLSKWYSRSWMSGWTLHLVDLAWVTCLPLFIQSAATHFYLLYPFLLFVLLAAAYRWGLYETLTTAGAYIGLVGIGCVVASMGGFANLYLPFQELSSKELAERAASLLMVACVVGYLGERGRELRIKTSLMARFTKEVHSETSVRETLEVTLGTILGIFDANRAALVVKEEKRQRAFLWQAEPKPGTHRCAVNWEELETFQQQRYLFPLPGASCSAVRRPDQGTRSFDLLAVDAQGRRLRRISDTLPDYFLAWHQFSTLLVASFTLGETREWSGRLFLFDPCAAGSREGHSRLLQELVREAGPAVYTVYRLRRLRSRAGGMERARIARELHDGVIQTLIGVEMRMDVLLRQATLDRSTDDELVQLQRLLRREIVNVRGLMQQIKSLDLSTRTVWESVADLVDKFQRDTGISAGFVAEPKKAALPPLLEREVLRIVGEALANVRKHSGARNVLVHFSHKNGLWKLVIEDDGRGFDFSGRLSQAELDALRKGPTVIKERVRSIGGELAVESTPGHGARLEITVAESVE